jgi:hypothetical protein
MRKHTRDYYEGFLIKNSLTYTDVANAIKVYNGRVLKCDEVMNYLIYKNFTIGELKNIMEGVNND